MNSKLVIIYGDNLVDGKNKDGQIEFLGEIGEDSLHILELKKFFKENFIGLFKKELIETMERYHSEVIAYYLIRNGHIVFFNTISPKNLKAHGKTGFFMMPDIDKISEKQKKSLLEFSTTIDDFKIEIESSIKLVDGYFFDSKTLRTGFPGALDLVNIFLSDVNEKEYTKK